MTISSVDRVRLEALLGMLGSPHAGERDNAAQLVEQFRAKRGLTWADVLGRQRLTDIPPNLQGHRPNQDPASLPAIIQIGNAPGDTVWRWSMMAGLVAVGSMSFVSLMRQPAAQMMTVDTAMDGRCAAGQADCAPPAKPAEETKPQPPLAAPVDLPPFAQGLADRKVSDTWRKSTLPGLCAGRFSPEQNELKSACLTARKLLTKFDQRLRTDPEYRRGWNAPPA